MMAASQLVQIRIFLAGVAATGLLFCSTSGCARREKVLEVQTPGGAVEVEKTTYPDGAVDVTVETDKK